MRGKIANRFLVNYVLMLFISILITFMVFALTDFANDLINKNLMKNNYTAEQLMKDDYKLINYDAVLENGGGIQIINSGLEIIVSEGIDTFGKNKLSVAEWTDFLANSKEIGVPYSFDIEYNAAGDYWIVVTFPTSIRIELDIAHNELYPSKDMQNVGGFIVAIVLFYLLSLAVVTVIYSRITSIGFVDPLKKLYQNALGREIILPEWKSKPTMKLQSWDRYLIPWRKKSNKKSHCGNRQRKTGNGLFWISRTILKIHWPA